MKTSVVTKEINNPTFLFEDRFFCDGRYRDLRPIGDGSYGFVASGVDTVTGNKVAIKKIKDVFLDVVDAKRILREIKLLKHFSSHENIITINDIFAVNPDSRKYDDVYLVTNLYESDLERITSHFLKHTLPPSN